MAEGEEEILGVPVKTEIVGDTKIITIEGANLGKLKDRMGLKRALREIRCVAPPIGCGREISAAEFETWDDLSIKEYSLTGLCMKPCQDKFFGPTDETGCTCNSPCCEADVGIIDCGSQHCPVHGENAYLTGEDGPTPPNDNLIPEEEVF